MDQEESPKVSVIELNSDYRHRRINLRNRTVLLGVAFTMAFLTVIQEPIGWSWIAWFALVPWVIAISGAKRQGRVLLVSYLAGLIYFLVNLHWLIGITPLGYGGLCFYLAWYFVVGAFVVRHTYRKRRWPFTFVLPILWVGQEYLRAIVMMGFPWFFLGHSLHESLRLIQICDVFGVYGVTFLIAMVNGLICDLLLRPLRSGQNKQYLMTAPVLILLTGCLMTGFLWYGHWRIKQGRETITAGEKITLVQEVIPQYVKEQGKSDEEIFSRHYRWSEQALQAEVKPRLIVWPETMVPGMINDEFISLSPLTLTEAGKQMLKACRSYDHRLRQLARKGTALLVGAPALTLDGMGESSNYNSAFLYLPDGKRFPERYDKMHLVPFGEVVPFKKSWPWLYDLLNHMTPYDYDYTLDAGEKATVFEFTSENNRTNRFAVAICYEDVMPRVVRRLAKVENGEKRVDFLLNISNDGWFVRGGKQGQPLTATSELIQHLVMCKFRAVENRIGIARAVNTGISAFIKPDGTLQHTGLAGNLPAAPDKRETVAGFITDRIYNDSRTSIYSRIGDIFAILCAILSGIFIIDGLRLRKMAQ